MKSLEKENSVMKNACLQLYKTCYLAYFIWPYVHVNITPYVLSCYILGKEPLYMPGLLGRPVHQLVNANI